MKKHEKKFKNLLSIGEVAKSIGVTRRMILNYENRGLLKPDVKEGSTGNRYYTTDTLTRIRTIRVFQNFGLSLDEIHSYFDDSTDLQTLIQKLEAIRDEINLSIEKLNARLQIPNEEIRRIILPKQLVYKKTMRADTIDQRKEHLRQIIPQAMRLYGSDTRRRMFFTEHPTDDPNLISYCISVPDGSQGEFICRLEEETALYISQNGDYDEMPKAKEKIIAYAKENNIPLTGICRHTYLEGPAQHKDKNKFITQVAMAIKTTDETKN